MKESGIWEKFFSVKISPLKTHKIVSICGLKLKFRCDGNRKALEKLRATIRENSVLIVETNTCHYEVIPGYAKFSASWAITLTWRFMTAVSLTFCAKRCRR